MKKLIFNNIKKAKGQLIALGLIMLITAVILNTVIVLLLQISDAYDDLFDELCTADLSVSVSSEMSSDELQDDISELDGVYFADKKDAIFATAALQNYKGSEFTMNTCFYRISETRELTKHKVLEHIQVSDDMCIYIPLYLAELGGYRVSDEIRYVIEDKEYSFTVGGIISEMQYGNYGTGFIGIYLSDEAYDALKDDINFTPVTEYLIRTKENFSPSEVGNLVSMFLKYKGVPVIAILDRETTKSSRSMVSSIVMLLLSVFALLMIIVSILLARSKIRKAIDEEMNEIGVLRSKGYTNRRLMFGQVIPYISVCCVGLLLGVAVSYAFAPFFASAIVLQSGFSYEPVFDVLAAGVIVLSVLALVFIFTILATRKIRRIEPINDIGDAETMKEPE